jgi:hypothetical protein
MAAGGAFLRQHAFDQVGDAERLVAGGRTLGAASRRGVGASRAGCGNGKMLGEKRSENLGQHERFDHTLLLGQKYILQCILVEIGGNLVVQNSFKAIGLGDLPACATETDLPAESGDAFITRPGFLR